MLLVLGVMASDICPINKLRAVFMRLAFLYFKMSKYL